MTSRTSSLPAPGWSASLLAVPPDLLLLGVPPLAVVLLQAALRESGGAPVPLLWPLLAFFLLVSLVLRGYPLVLLAAPLALLAAVPGSPGADPAEVLERFLGAFGAHITQFFPLIALGALFARLIDDSGCARGIALGFARLGPRAAGLALVLTAAVLTAGGISVFVVAMACVPIGRAMFEERGLQPHLLPAFVALGAFTFAMTSLPGAPTIINGIAASQLGTTALAAPREGLLAAAIMLSFGLAWLALRIDARCRGPLALAHASRPRPPVGLAAALLPVGSVIAASFLLSSWLPTGSRGLQALIPALLSLLVGIALVLLLHAKRIDALRRSLDQGVASSFGPLLAVASGVGFGTVLIRLPAVAPLLDQVSAWADALPMGGIAARVALLAGLAGSSAGGLNIALAQFGPQALDAVRMAAGDPDRLHRITAIACGTLDTLPHSGAVLLLLGISGQTHRSAYPDLFVVTVLGPLLALVGLLALGPL